MNYQHNINIIISSYMLCAIQMENLTNRRTVVSLTADSDKAIFKNANNSKELHNVGIFSQLYMYWSIIAT